MAINSREKGKKGELELSRALKEHGYDTRRGQQYCGSNGDADVIGLPYLHIECKRVEKLNLRAAMELMEKGEVNAEEQLPDLSRVSGAIGIIDR